MNPENLSDLSILELFRLETETQSCILTNGLVGLARDADPSQLLGELM